MVIALLIVIALILDWSLLNGRITTTLIAMSVFLLLVAIVIGTLTAIVT